MSIGQRVSHLIHKVPYVIAGILVFILAFCWYVVVEVVWFSSTLKVTKVRATYHVLVVVFMANILVVLAALGIAYAFWSWHSAHRSAQFPNATLREVRKAQKRSCSRL
jgi:hypothetical protein